MKAAASPSPELALLVACDLAGDAELAARDLAGIDWPRFVALAHAHEMAAIASARIGARMPAEMAENLASALQSSVVLEMAQTAMAASLTRHLEAAGVPVLVLKGVALGHQLYGANPHWRSATDIDLLIAPERLDTADKILRERGFLRQWPQEMPRRGRAMFLHLANVCDYVSPASGQLVELHHRITLNPHWLPLGFDELHAASVEIATPQGPIRGLDGPPLVAYLCWHALAHDGFRLKWVCDIARALAHVGASHIGAASCLAACLASEGYARRPLELADRLLACFGLSEAAPDARTARIVADMEAPVSLPTGRTLAGMPQELAFRAFLFRLSPGLRGKGYEVLRALSDPRDAALLGLPQGLAPLLALVGPPLSLLRLFTRKNEADQSTG